MNWIEWVKKHPWKTFFGGIIITIILIPLGVNYGIEDASYRGWGAGSNGDWINFWGSYLGSIIGLPITVIVAILTINMEKKNTRSSRQSDELNKMIEATVTFQIQIESFIRNEISDDDYPSIHALSKQVVDLFRSQVDEFFVLYNISRTKLRGVDNLWKGDDFFTDENAKKVEKLFADNEVKVAKIINVLNSQNISSAMKEIADQTGKSIEEVNSGNVVGLNSDLKEIKKSLDNNNVTDLLDEMASQMVKREAEI